MMTMTSSNNSPQDDHQQALSEENYAPAPEVTGGTGRRPLQTVFNDGRHYPRLSSFAFRRGTLTDNQEATWEANWPRLGKELDEQVNEQYIDLDEWFGRHADTIVEIGSGTGTSTAAMAPLETDKNIVAVELYRPGLAKLVGAVSREGIENIRMIKGDGVEVLQRMFRPESLAGVRIFFPDPWPKARHHKRRIVQTGTLHLIASRLRPGGILHIATDHADYAEWIDELVNAEPQLEYIGWPEELASGADDGRGHLGQLVDRQLLTKFENKGLRKEHTITEYLWTKK